MHYLETYVKPLFASYLETLLEALFDINAYVDALIDSELGHSFLIALIIAAPFAGVFIFYTVLMLAS